MFMKYISILRGINVSGQKKIKMADLRSFYENQGLGEVRTYIQSGNVLFVSETRSKEEIKRIIEEAIKENYGFHVPVDIRTEGEYKKIIEDCPFKEAQFDRNNTKVLISFLSGEPPQNKVDQLESKANPPEKLKVGSRVVYLYCPNGYGKSKLSNSYIESGLGLVSTTRNWKTVLKLLELSQLNDA